MGNISVSNKLNTSKVLPCLKSNHVFHIENLLEINPDAQVVELGVVEEREATLTSVITSLQKQLTARENTVERLYINIYMMIHVSELDRQPTIVQEYWKKGRDLYPNP